MTTKEFYESDVFRKAFLGMLIEVLEPFCFDGDIEHEVMFDMLSLAKSMTENLKEEDVLAAIEKEKCYKY